MAQMSTPEPPNRATPRRARIALACATIAALVLVGCSSGGGSSASGTTTTSLSSDPSCVAMRKLQKTIVNLTSPGLLTGGRRAVDTAAAKVKRDLNELRDAVDSDLKPSVDALSDSVDQLRGAAALLGRGSLTQNLRLIGNAIQSVGQDAQALVQELKDKCAPDA